MKGTILVVDDERSIRVGLKGLLAKEGHEVSTAESGEEALRLLDHHQGSRGDGATPPAVAAKDP